MEGIKINKFKEMYKQKLCTAEEAAKLVENGGSCISGIACGQPRMIYDAIARREEKLEGVSFFTTLDVYPSDIWKLDNNYHIQVDSGFIGGQMRKGVHQGIYTYSPVKFSESIKALQSRFPAEKRTVAAVVSPMDKHGYFSLGCSIDYSYTMARDAKNIIVEVNENMPRSHGKCWLHISQISAIVENHVPLPALPDIPVSEKDKLMGKLIAEQVSDGACIQIGVGAVPNAVAIYLEDKNDLGVHTEMITDSVFRLQQRGVITNRKKTYMPDVSLATFALGSKEMYEWMDDNPSVAMYPVDLINEPNIIAQEDNMISVNAALSVDLTGQVCSESFGPLQWSNVGGQLDFVQGAYKSRGGKSFITLYSTAKNDTISRIVSQLEPGSHITTPRTETHYVVTEYGIALIKGQSAKQRALNLISVAHPDHREKLTIEAKKMGLI